MVRIAVDNAVIAELCRRNHIRSLHLFGSVLRDDFRPDSDVDLLVEFDKGYDPGLAILSMEDELRGIFGRDVDLLLRDSVESNRNYVIRKHILRTLEPLYVA